MASRRNPDLIARSRTDADADPEAERVAEAEKKRAQHDAAVERSETAARSWIAYVIGVGEEARMAAIFIIVIIIIISGAIVLISTNDASLRSSILDLFGKVILIGIGFLAGQGASRKR